MCVCMCVCVRVCVCVLSVMCVVHVLDVVAIKNRRKGENGVKCKTLPSPLGDGCFCITFL